MDLHILTAGIVVTLLFITGVFLSHRERLQRYDERERMKKNRNEYRTNEEFISYP